MGNPITDTLQFFAHAAQVMETDVAKIAANPPEGSETNSAGQLVLPPVRGHYRNFNYSFTPILTATPPDTSNDMPLTLSGILGVAIQFAEAHTADVQHTFYRAGLEVVVDLSLVK